MKRNIYLAAILVASSGFGISYLTSKTHDSYTPRTEEEKAQNVYLTSKERSIKGAIEYYNLIRKDINTGEVPADGAKKALAQLNARGAKYKKTLPLKWGERGPNNVGGRTRAILVDNRDNKIMYCGGVSGGLFRSTNRAQSWSPVDDHLDNMIVTSITQTPDGYIYIGTGEEPFLLSPTNGEGGSGFIGGGMFRSADGITFEYLTSTNNAFTWRNTTALASDPNTNRIYAGNTGGLYWSEDKGDTWTKVTPSISQGAQGCRHIAVAKDGVVYAHIASKVYKSTNGKTDYVEITPTNAATQRFEIALAHDDLNYVYLMGSGNDNRMSGVWRSTDRGENWDKVLERSTFFDPCNQLGIDYPQGKYDLAISVAPFDKERVFLGGVQLGMWRKSEGEALIATTFNQDPRNSLYVHADKHEFLWDLTVDPPVMWIGTDGGVAVTDFQVSSSTGRPTYAHMSKGLNIFQSYGVAANEQRHVISGAQDNGNQLMNFGGNHPWDAVEVFGGDGFQNEYSRTKPNILFVESQNGNMARSQNKGESFSSINDGRLGPSGGNFAFNTQFRIWENLDGTDSATLFAVGKNGSVFISPNILDFSVNPIFFKVANFPTGTITHEMEFTPDGNNLYVGTSGGQLYRLSNLLNATYDSSIVGGNDVVPDVVAEQINVGSGLPSGRAVTGIGIDPMDSNFMVITYGNYNSGNHVYISTNASDPSPSFTAKQGDLPDFPVYDIQVVYTGDKSNPKRILVIGTEFGVFASDDDGATWTEQNDGMARVPTFKVRAYEFKPWEGYRLYLGTHGRGVFESLSLMTSVKNTQKVTNEKLVIYPNPATTYATVKFNLNATNDVAISVVDIQGRVVVSNIHTNQTAGENEYTINTASLPAGTYFVRVETPTQKGYSKLLVVK